MNSKFCLLIIILVFSASLVYGAQVDQKVINALNSNSEISVIIKLKDAPGTNLKQIKSSYDKKESLKDKLDIKREMVKTQQNKVLSKLNVKTINTGNNPGNTFSISNTAPLDLTLTHKYSSVNMFSGKLTRQGLQKLRNNPDVESIHITGTKKIMLDVSIPLINATKAWSVKLNDTNITGTGETVCIIDTGIDFNHTNLGGIYGNQVIGGYRALGGGADVQDCDFNNTACLDDHGHGTHVAGIVASNHSTYTGVAPDVNLISIKVCNSAGSCNDNDIITAIDWCVNNASKYNISVISMSLGDNSTHSSYCNNAFTSPIDTAVGQGIIVTVAAGNCQAVSCTAGPSSPACVENATAIGGVNDADSITGFGTNGYQRGPLFELLAPGVGIISLNDSGGTTSMSGTSMSTPHAAGAIALLQQFSKLQNGTSLTSQQVKTTLNNTGKRIDDTSGSGYNFSRIDIYSALLSINNAPTITFVDPTPANNTNISQTFTIINITSNENLSIALLEIGGSNYTMDGNATNWYLNQTTLSGIYDYKVYGNDSLGKFGVSIQRRIWTNYTNPNITSYYPTNLAPNITEQSNQTFNITYEDLDNNNVTVTWYRNSTNVSNNDNYTFASNLTDAGIWNITAVITDNLFTDSITWTLNVTNTNVAPNITSYEPSDTTPTISETQNQTFAINYSDFDNDIIAVIWYLNNSNVSSKDNYTFIGNYTNAGYWNVTVVINDTNATDSQEWTLNVTNVNRAPVLSLQNLTVNETNLVNITNYANATDPDGDSVTINYSSPLNSSGLWLTTFQNSSNTTVTITATDGTNSTSEILTIQVLDLNDTDNDGYYNLTNSSDPNHDCNDAAATTNPGASEICSDSIDNDCDGSVDEGCTTTSSSGGGGGGGSSSSKTYNLVIKETPQLVEMKQNDRISFSYKSEPHVIRASTILSNSVELYISSTPQLVNILFGESKQVDIDDDLINDLVLKPTKKDTSTIKLAVSKVKTSTCFDGKRNQGEIFTDCGGPCPACEPVPTCYDNIQNQNEEDVDCGGPCPACPEPEETEEVTEEIGGVQEDTPEPKNPKKMWKVLIGSLLFVIIFTTIIKIKSKKKLSGHTARINKDLDNYVKKSLENMEDKFDSVKKN